MKHFQKALLASFLILSGICHVWAQAEKNPNPSDPKKQPLFIPDSRGYNPNSVRPIHESDIMFKRTVWRVLDLNEKQNRPFMAANSEISRIIFDGVKSGKLIPYTSDSLTQKLAIAEFLKRLADPNIQPIDVAQRTIEIQNDAFLTPAEKQKAIADIKKQGSQVVEVRSSNFSQLELKEDIIFDKQRSRMYYDVQSITIYLPGTNNQGVGGGVDLKVASFKFKDLVKFFRNNPNAIWFNELNNREHKNLADAFDLRLFSSIIFKISNPRDQSLDAIYNGRRSGLIAAQQQEYKLMEFEHNLWEF
jgi:gliding motility associated protien GldN